MFYLYIFLSQHIRRSGSDQQIIVKNNRLYGVQFANSNLSTLGTLI